MAADRNSPPLPSPNATDRRRSSFSANTFVELFGRSNSTAGPKQQSPSQIPGPITSAAAQAQQRRLSLTTLGLSGSASQASPFVRSRGESISSSTGSNSVDESPFEDDAAASTPSTSNGSTPFARRLSFGARAMGQMKQGNGNASGRQTSVDKPRSPPSTTKSRGEGFNFGDNLRQRAQRGSISGAPPVQSPSSHHRAKSVAVMEPAPAPMPQPKQPDAFQERILKGDFYMD